MVVSTRYIRRMGRTSGLLAVSLALPACNDPSTSQAPVSLPSPQSPTPAPVLYDVDLIELQPYPAGSAWTYHVTLGVRSDSRVVLAADIHLWATGRLSAILLHPDGQGNAAVDWDTEDLSRSILSACAVPPGADPCLATVVVRR